MVPMYKVRLVLKQQLQVCWELKEGNLGGAEQVRR